MGRKTEKESVERDRNTKVKRQIITRKMKTRNEMKRKGIRKDKKLK